MDNLEHKQWTGKTGGKPWMQKSLILLFKYLDIRVMYFMMSLVIPFYMLFKQKDYLTTYHFYKKRFGYSVLKSFANVYLNFFTFGQIVLDKFAMYAGKKFKINIEGMEYFNNLDEQSNGFLQLSSHTGNYELAGYTLVSKHKRFNALVFADETETVMQNRQRILSQHNISMIPVKADMSHLFLINNALCDGEIVSMPADRIFGSQKYVECPFFGETAKFPLGPFALAVQRKVAVLSVFVMKNSAKRYTIYVKPIDNTTQSQNKYEKMEQLAQQFAVNLENIVKKYPKQWFNYFDFWK